MDRFYDEQEDPRERARHILADGSQLRAEIAERERIVGDGWQYDDALSARENMVALDAYERLTGTGATASAHRAAPPVTVRSYSEPPAPRPVQPVMPADQQAGWDRWAKAHIRNALAANNRTLMKGIGEGMAMYVGKRLDAFADVMGQEAAAENRLGAELDATARTAGNILGRLMALEAQRDGRALSRIGARHV